jgi:Uma2 family endonuclease
MSATTTLKTAEDLYLMGEDSRFELIAGVLHPVSPPSKPHGRIVLNIASPLWAYNQRHRLGTVYTETGFTLERDPDTVFGPDIAFVCAGGPPEEEGFSPIAPDLVVEVVSPSDRRSKIEDRVRRYLATGFAIVVIVWSRSRTVDIHDANDSRTLREGDELADLSVLPGFRLPVSDIFQ